MENITLSAARHEYQINYYKIFKISPKHILSMKFGDVLGSRGQTVITGKCRTINIYCIIYLWCWSRRLTTCRWYQLDSRRYLLFLIFNWSVRSLIWNGSSCRYLQERFYLLILVTPPFASASEECVSTNTDIPMLFSCCAIRRNWENPILSVRESVFLCSDYVETKRVFITSISPTRRASVPPRFPRITRLL